MNEHLYELFVLKCAPIRAAIESSLARFDFASVRASASLRDDPLIRDYLAQIALDDRTQAERMSEYYKVFYMLENFIRDFVASVLSAEEVEDWWATFVPERIRDGAEKARDRELSAGVTPRSAEYLEYTTFGELSEIIKANWDLFGGFFQHPRGFETVMARLNTLRGPIMHCGTLAEDEVLRLKLSVRDWFKLFEANGVEGR